MWKKFFLGFNLPVMYHATLSLALALALVSCAMGPGAQAPAAMEIAGLVIPSATPPATNAPPRQHTPPPTNTPTLTPTNTPTPTPIPTFTPTPTRVPSPRTVRVPILMYHYISVPPPDADKYRLDLSVTPANFEAQMEYLAIEGYTPIRVSDLAEHLLSGAPLPPKPIALTFDDGYLDNYQNAFPVLKNYRFTATFNVITDFIDGKKPGYMNWDQLEELAIERFEIGAHTLDHPDLFRKPRAFQEQQIAGSKAVIEARIGTPVKTFTYPSSQYDATTIEVIRSAGYLAALSELQGTRQSSDQIYELQRIRVRGSYTVKEFAYSIKYLLSNGK